MAALRISRPGCRLADAFSASDDEFGMNAAFLERHDEVLWSEDF
jgi:hypothetical protein